MTVKTILIATLGTLLIAFSSLGSAKGSTPRERLNHFFTTVNSLEGDFKQVVYNKKGKMIQTSEGQLYLNRPGKFRWVYQTPDPQVIVADGKNIWIYDEDLEQVTIKAMSNLMGSAPIAILVHKQSPDVQFIVKAMKTTSGGLDWFQLIPRTKSKDFRLIELGLDKQGLRQMNMLDQLGQKTVIKLTTTVNKPIKASLFTFQIPQGVDVIGKAL